MHLRPAADPLERKMYIAGCYEPATLALMDEILEPGGVMVDVGANLGLMSLHAARRLGSTGTVIAVEPHPVYFERLERNIARNHFRNIRAWNLAAGSRAGEARIFDVPSVNIGRSSLIDPGNGARQAGSVKIKTLDEILDGLEPHFLKIDVEGFEWEVLKGARKTLQARPVICMELAVSLPGADPFAAHEFLMATGHYDCFRFTHTKFSNSTDLSAVRRIEDLFQFEDNLIYRPKI